MDEAARHGRRGARDGAIRSHFGITVGGVPIAYCYIRKNACSAFKRMFVAESPVPFDRTQWRREIEFMTANHGLRTLADIERQARRIVVVRDPVERYVSAFVSLLVAQSPPPTKQLRNRATRLMDRPVEEVSFDMMLEHQLPGPGVRRGRIERHFWPQTWHLAPLTYTDVIDIEDLSAAMKAMIGEELGARYFDRPVNATAGTPTYDDPDVTAQPAHVLAERFRTTGALPSKASFLTGGREDRIRAAYAEDGALYEACRAHGRAGTAAPMELRVPEATPERRRAGRPNRRKGGRKSR